MCAERVGANLVDARVVTNRAQDVLALVQVSERHQREILAQTFATGFSRGA